MSSIEHGLQYAKIIAIVDKETGEVRHYDWTLTKENQDYFADPKDRKEFFAITVKPIACDSISELKAKFEAASQYLGVDFEGTIKKVIASKHLSDVNKKGLVDYDRKIRLRRKIRVSPFAHGEEKVYGDEYMRVINNSKMMAMDYKLNDRVLVSDSHVNLWFTIAACHETKDEHIIIGSAPNDELVQFRPKHVLAYRTAKADLSLKMRRFQAKLKKAQKSRG